MKDTKTIQIKNKELLTSFKLLKPERYETIQTNDFIRYYIDNDLKYGGFVKHINLEKKYIVLANYNKHVSWCVQLTNPQLKIYIKSRKKMQEEKTAMRKVFQMYKEGQLVKQKKISVT